MKYERQENQRAGRNRNTLINHTYIKSGAYRKKFNHISNNRKLNKLIYQIAKKMLFHRTGTLYEDMYWINPHSISVIAKEITCHKESSIRYSKSTRKILKEHHGLITIHSHPHSSPPSFNDLLSNYQNHYSLGIICCHDGKLFLYYANEPINYFVYETAIAKYRKKGYDEDNSQVFALKELEEKYDIRVREVLV